MDQTDGERMEDLDGQPYVSGYNLDVDQLVRHELLLNLPMKVLWVKIAGGFAGGAASTLIMWIVHAGRVRQT